MINGTAVRVLIVAALIPLTLGGAGLVETALEPPGAELPDWRFDKLPEPLDNWRGEETKLDPEIAKATGATVIFDRAYRDDSGHVVSMHTAMFDDPADGVIHSPLTCYRAAGWKRLSEDRVNLQLSYKDSADNVTLPVSISRWEREGDQQVLVVYWYQLGEHVLFGRLDLGLNVRWSLAGKPKWPALIKVMLSIPAAEGEKDAKSAILGLAEKIATWENQPEHRKGKGMLGIQAGSSGGG
jgi:EpsI family protein